MYKIHVTRREPLTKSLDKHRLILKSITLSEIVLSFKGDMSYHTYYIHMDMYIYACIHFVYVV